MKSKKKILAILLAVASFAACTEEQEDKEQAVIPNEPMKATYLYYGDLVSVMEEPEEEYSWSVEGNTLIIDRNAYWMEIPSSEDYLKIDVETFHDTIYLIERCYRYGGVNCICTRHTKVALSNIPKGKWVVYNDIEFCRYFPGFVGDEPTHTPGIRLKFPHPFTIEVE